jgi:hypothetical protein
LIEEQQIEAPVGREIAKRVEVTPVFLAAIGNEGTDAFGSHLCAGIHSDFLDKLPVAPPADYLVSGIGFLQLALTGRVQVNALENGIDNRSHLGRVEVSEFSLNASVGVRGKDPGHFFHDSIVWINRVSSGAGVHHVGVKNDAGDERFTSGADNARRIPQKPKRQADVPVAIINPDRGILRRKYAEQAALDRHADLAGGAPGRKAVDVFMMVEINVGPLAIKPGPTFDIAVQRYAPNGMSFDEFLPSYDNPR